MSAFEVNEFLVERLKSEKYQFIMVNFANCDMVGHTGIMEAAMKAVNTVDCVLAKAIPLAYELGYDCLITADHGNAEQMVDEETGEAFTEHTVNPVPFCLLSRSSVELRPSGKLCDIAPTVLELMGIEKPAAMTGRSLIAKKK
ncbi:MAG TPA: 2,3-bisphosphoglycerate-independent phosphoglycerate mutase, partial [Candidatus Rifleibacterium sp.]|nr:2,3-bisphosphoglycerate-independent phosphoglycerate mutase [Candidatus Rifleibacterium sp.]